MSQEQLTINVEKTKLMVFGNKKTREKILDTNIVYEGQPIKEVPSYNYLGIKIDQKLTYDNHAGALIQRVTDKLKYLRRIRRFINSKAALAIYKNMILPILEYGDILLISTKVSTRKRLQTLQNKALKCALGVDPLTSTEEVHSMAKLDRLHIRRQQHIMQLMYKQKDHPFLWARKTARRSGVATRSSKKKQFILKKVKTEKLRKSITNKAPHLWNKLPKEIQNLPDIKLFKFRLTQHLKKIDKDKRGNLQPAT